MVSPRRPLTVLSLYLEDEMMKQTKRFSQFALAALLAAGCLGPGQAWADTTLSLAPGWNLLSSSTAISDAAATFGDQAKFTSVWTWDAAANNGGGAWQVFLAKGKTETDSYAQSKGFTSLTAITPGQGFWLNTVAAQGLTLPGAKATESSLSLAKGWNLKGSNIVIDVAKTFAAKASDGTTNKYASVWKWAVNANSGAANWQVFLSNGETASYAGSKGFGVLTTVIPGEGFWVNVNSGQQGDLVVTPPVIAGTVSYPTANTLGKVAALAKASGLFASSGAVEMPPQPGATVTVYDATDAGQTAPLATTTTDSSGGYCFTADSFNDPATDAIEQPPSVPVVVSAEFQSPIDKKNKVKVKALVDPNDKGGMPINPLTTAIGDKVMGFIKETFKIAITKEIMGAAKPFIDLIAGQVEAQGLTNFKEDGLVIKKFTSPDWQGNEDALVDKNFMPPDQPNIANTMLDAATGGLFTGMEDALINKGLKDSNNQQIVIDPAAKQDNLERLLASLGFAVQTKTPAGVDAILLFVPSPWEIAETDLPGETRFGDRAFRQLTVADLGAESLATLNGHPVFLHTLKEAVNNAPTLSSEAVAAIGAAIEASQTTTLAGVAAVIADQFQWQTKAVQVVNGVPIFSDVAQAPSTGAAVSATELIAALSGKIGESPEEVAKDIASQPHNIMRLADKVLNQKFNLIGEDETLSDKKGEVANFTQGIKDFGDLKELVQQSDLFQQEVQAIAHRLYAALEPGLYGQVLSAATELKVKSALMVIMIMTNRDYLIDPDAGWFTVKGTEGQGWIEPNFANRKWLTPKAAGPGVPSAVLGQLLASPIADGQGFTALIDAFHGAAKAIDDAASGVTITPGDGGVLPGIMGEKVTMTTVTGHVLDASGQAWVSKEISLEPHDGQTGTPTKLTVSTGNAGFFSLANLPTGSAYDMRFAGNDFVFPFYADPFSAKLPLGDIFLPPTKAMGGAKGFPAVSLWLDQTFFNFNDPQDANNGKPQGLDFSNFNTEKPFIVFDGDPNGTIDLRWTTQGLTPVGAASIAVLGGTDWQVEKLNDDALLKHTFTKAELAGEAVFTLDAQSGTLTFGDGMQGARLPEGDHGVYVVRDNGGQYFFIEVRKWEKSDAGVPNGGLELGFAKLGTGGQIELPKESFIGGSTPGVEPGGMGKVVVSLNPGDVYDLDANAWSAPSTEPFGYDQTASTNSDIAWLASFYSTYWQDTTDPDIRKAALAKSDRALSVVNGATLFTVTIQKDATPPYTMTKVVDGVEKDVKPGNLFMVTSSNNNSFVLLAKSVDPDAIEFAILPKDKLMNADGTLNPIWGMDQDGDGIPAILDDNDFTKDAYNPDDFQMIDADSDGVPAKFDPDDSDANVPNNGGKPGMIDMAQQMSTLCVQCHQDQENHKADIQCDNSVWLEHAQAPAPGSKGVGLDVFNAVSSYKLNQICSLGNGGNGGGGGVTPVALSTICLTCHKASNHAEDVNCSNSSWKLHKNGNVSLDVFNVVSTYLTGGICQ